MKTIEYEVPAGNHIRQACIDAVKLAKSEDAFVDFWFNEITVTAGPKSEPAALVAEWVKKTDAATEAWRNSPAGIRSEKTRAGEIKQRQAKVDEILRAFNEADSLDALIELLSEFLQPADDIGVHFDKAALAWELEAKGYVLNEGVGEKPEWFSTRERLGRYIIGQVIACLRRGMPPHGFLETFARQYRALPAQPDISPRQP